MRQPRDRSATRRHRARWASLLIVAACLPVARAADGDATSQLIDRIFDYRAQNGLPAIPLSDAMTRVARAHVADLERHPPQGRCTAHSWSTNGPWSACCYTPEHDEARCMWDKPREITRGAYAGEGFEIVCRNADGMTADAAMDCWRNSRLHHGVLLNRGPWRDTPWRALGVSVSRHYAVIWLGQVAEG